MMNEDRMSEDAIWANELDGDAWDDGQRYWREEVERLAAELGQAGEWPSWEPMTYGDGVTPMPRRYRSLCEGRSYRLDRSFQILQQKSEAGPVIAAWVNDHEHDELWVEDDSPRLPKTMLVINLSRSAETDEVARTLLRKWMSQETTAADMMAFIHSTLARG
jgi:hypothetical protein